jgi:hypothetical protein
MGQPYECMDGVCQDVVSWSPMGIAAAVAITVIAVCIIAYVVGEIRRK